MALPKLIRLGAIVGIAPGIGSLDKLQREFDSGKLEGVRDSNGTRLVTIEVAAAYIKARRRQPSSKRNDAAAIREAVEAAIAAASKPKRKRAE